MAGVEGFGTAPRRNVLRSFSQCPSVEALRLFVGHCMRIGLHANWSWIVVISMQRMRLLKPSLEEAVYINFPPGCSELFWYLKVVRLDRNTYGLGQASRAWHRHLVRGKKCLGFGQSPADACVMRLMEECVMTMVVFVH